MKFVWVSKHIIVFTSKRFRILYLEDNKDIRKQKLLYDSKFRVNDLGETLHIYKKENDFTKTSIVLPDEMFTFYKLELKNNISSEKIKEKVSQKIGKTKEGISDWEYVVVGDTKSKIYVLAYILSGKKFNEIKNAFKLSNIEVESIKPRLLYDFILKNASRDILGKNKADREVEVIHKKKEESKKLPKSTDNVPGVSFPELEITKPEKKSNGKSSLHFEGLHVFSPWMLIIFIFILLFIGTVIYGVYSLRSKIDTIETETINAQRIPATTTPTEPPDNEDEVKLKDLEILVMGNIEDLESLENVENILLIEGALSIDTDNSQTTLSKDTIIQTKEFVTSEIAAALFQALESEYSVVEGTLSVDNDYEVVILVGERKDDTNEDI
ncbi:hypothetical protein ACFL2C_03760 [Patescibacteria group bacterium]